MEDTELATTSPDIDTGSPGDSAETEAPLSDRDEIRAAFEETIAERSAPKETSEESNDASTEAPKDGQAATSSEATPTPEAVTRPMTEQQAFDRALSLHRAGRTHELPPEVQGQIRKWEADTVARHAEEQKLEKDFDELYLDMLALQEEDPAEFARQLRDPELGRDRLEFLDKYAKLHPEVTLDNPRRGEKVKSEAEIRAEQNGMLRETLDKSFRAFAEEHGVSNFEELRASAAGAGTFLTSVMQAVVDAKVAKELPNLRKAEGDAAYKQAMADYGMSVPKVSLSGSGRGAAPRGRNYDPGSVSEAFDLALAEREN